jgi:hypothetical protein
MGVPRRGLTDRNVYQVHNLKAETAFFSTVNTVATVRCFSPLRWSIVGLAGTLSSKTPL